MRGLSASKLRIRLLTVVFTVALGINLTLGVLLRPGTAHAADESDAFSLQVSPSPLTATIKPGVTTTLDLQIRNTSNKALDLKMGLRTFAIDDATGQVKLGDTEPADLARFVTFGAARFTLQAGQIYGQRVQIKTPASAGFSYSFAITISQATPPDTSAGKTALQGSVAVFTLLNVDKPGATRTLSLSSLSATKNVYEFLPASFKLKLRNTGNSLVQPGGTLFIQRGNDNEHPIASVKLNPTDGYIVPGSSRTLSIDWNDGVPHYVTTTANGTMKRSLNWSGSDASKLRFGRYVAKVVAVYNDGRRDVPLTAEVSFWVIPWRLIFGGLVVALLLLVGIITILRKSTRHLPKRKPKDRAA